MPTATETRPDRRTELQQRLLVFVRVQQTTGRPVKSARDAIKALRVRRMDALRSWNALRVSGQIARCPGSGIC